MIYARLYEYTFEIFIMKKEKKKKLFRKANAQHEIGRGDASGDSAKDETKRDERNPCAPISPTGQTLLVCYGSFRFATVALAILFVINANDASAIDSNANHSSGHFMCCAVCCVFVQFLLMRKLVFIIYLVSIYYIE